MRWITQVNGERGTPFPQIDAEPDPITVVRYFRPADKMVWGGFTFAFPAIFYVWERHRPTGHPKYVGRAALAQVPFYFGMGFFYAYATTMTRFWGWIENKRESERYEKDSAEGTLKPEWWNWR